MVPEKHLVGPEPTRRALGTLRMLGFLKRVVPLTPPCPVGSWQELAAKHRAQGKAEPSALLTIHQDGACRAFPQIKVYGRPGAVDVATAHLRFHRAGVGPGSPIPLGVTHCPLPPTFLKNLDLDKNIYSFLITVQENQEYPLAMLNKQ